LYTVAVGTDGDTDDGQDVDDSSKDGDDDAERRVVDPVVFQQETVLRWVVEDIDHAVVTVGAHTSTSSARSSVKVCMLLLLVFTVIIQLL
jgi:hypothetical protein